MGYAILVDGLIPPSTLSRISPPESSAIAKLYARQVNVANSPTASPTLRTRFLVDRRRSVYY
ncbi:hypothetical protein LX36DRAFT_651669 [Colletotrichum falcatum]|nr:hypothetical protein LX36DRAFT_651669 [Colletotrichum falcatum]